MNLTLLLDFLVVDSDRVDGWAVVVVVEVVLVGGGPLGLNGLDGLNPVGLKPDEGRSGSRSSLSMLERISSNKDVSVVDVVVVVGLNPGGRNLEMSSWIRTSPLVGGPTGFFAC